MSSNNTKVLRSRILEHFPKQAMEEIKKLVYNNRINDINDKIEILMGILDKYDIDYSELGTGTNRTAIFIDGYVFKIALDKWGVRDNDQEFTLSEELQPYVIKVYECNGIIMVCEYVVVINKEEFAERKSQIRRILADLSNEYLLGDIGTINKNFANWGYRDSQELVALDFAYIYRIIGNELKCDCEVAPLLEYTPDYDRLVCPHCRKKYMFMDVRRRISTDMEHAELEMSKERAYKLTSKIEKVESNEVETEEEAYEQQTFRFNLHDYTIYKDMEEKRAMENLRRNQEQPENIIDINEDYTPSDDDMYDEISLLLAMKNGQAPKDSAKIHVDKQEDEVVITQEEYFDEKARLDKETDELQKIIDKMKQADEEEEINSEEAEQNLYDEIIKLTEDKKEHGEHNEDNNSTIVVDSIQVNIESEEAQPQQSYYLCRPVKSAYIKRALQRKPIEVVQEVKEEIEEEPIPVKSVQLEMVLDKEISENVQIDAMNEEEQELKDEISNMLLKYMAMKGIDTQDLDLSFNVALSTKKNHDIIIMSHKDDTEEVEPAKVEIVEEPEVVSAEEIQNAILSDGENDDEYKSYMASLIQKYGQVDEQHEELYVQAQHVEIHQQDEQVDLDEELRKMYDELS